MPFQGSESEIGNYDDLYVTTTLSQTKLSNLPIHSKNLSTLSFMTMRNCLASQLYNMTLHISLDPHQLPRLSDKRHVFGVGGCKGEGNVAFQVTPICHYYSQGGSID